MRERSGLTKADVLRWMKAHPEEVEAALAKVMNPPRRRQGAKAEDAEVKRLTKAATAAYREAIDQGKPTHLAIRAARLAASVTSTDKNLINHVIYAMRNLRPFGE